jgi:hypothetical protein
MQLNLKANLKFIVDQLSPQDKKLLSENRSCFVNEDWYNLVDESRYLLVMLALARTNTHGK